VRGRVFGLRPPGVDGYCWEGVLAARRSCPITRESGLEKWPLRRKRGGMGEVSEDRRKSNPDRRSLNAPRGGRVFGTLQTRGKKVEAA